MKWKLLVIFLLTIFVRFYLLDVSTHFLSDESRDLVNIHQIFVEKKITLVGPVSDDRSHVYSSLTYYMLLPFAAFFDFDPFGTVAGAAVWGIIVWAILVAIAYKLNKRNLLFIALAAAVWFPLVQTSRWPWNPNLMLFWLAMGIFMSSYKHPLLRISAGLCMGLSVHHHYLALVPMVLMIIKQKDMLYLAGAVSAFLPFVLFDLRHPPGIFITRMIDYNKSQMGTNPIDLFIKLPQVIKYFLEYVFQEKIVFYIGGITAAALALWDFVKRSYGRPWFLISILTLFPLSMYSQQFHYLLPAIPFFAMWIIAPRTGLGAMLSKSMIILIFIGSVLSLPIHWSQADWEGNLKILRGATQIIGQEVREKKMINANMAVLSSPDIYPLGKRYRDVLLVNDIRLKTYEEFELSDNLFVVTKGSVADLRKDPAMELIYFRNGPVAGVWEIPESNWRVIQLNRY
jgi:hypothetical protein